MHDRDQDAETVLAALRMTSRAVVQMLEIGARKRSGV